MNRFSSTPDIFLDSQNDGERESGGDLSPNFQTFKKPKNRFQGTKDRYDNPIPTWFLAPKDCLKIPAMGSVCVSLSGDVNW